MDVSRNEAKLLTLNRLLRRAVPADSVGALVCTEEFNVDDEAWDDSVDTAKEVAAIEVATADEANEAEEEAEEDEAEVDEEDVGGGEDEDEDDEEGEGDDRGEDEDEDGEELEVEVEVEVEAEKDEWADDLRWSMKACLALRSKADVWM
ncbi:hypothetical protein BGZ70_005261 [Mortierella alpina]|uniref:Uncharacterized protein n=1 Tax=Mortierella alpina TaxID=64518 RepID=A0A9P6J9J3_MORAP|nr:hypothetical protein BGZ70_005261 [Mortierella alpina]